MVCRSVLTSQEQWAPSNLQPLRISPSPVLPQSLAGKIAGVHIAQATGIAGADGAQITIRGLGTLNNTKPLILIDGVISDNMDMLNPTRYREYIRTKGCGICLYLWLAGSQWCCISNDQKRWG